MSVMSKELVPSSGMYIFSMQGSACGACMDTRGDVSSKGTGYQAKKDIWKALLG
jgi:hypothetical protein